MEAYGLVVLRESFRSPVALGQAIGAAQSIGAALQNLMLAAHATGLASCWMCAPLFCPATVVGDLPEDSPVLAEEIFKASTGVHTVGDALAR